jgi:CBS domain-containing protein
MGTTVIVREEASMQVRDGMSTEVLTVGPDHTLRAASRAMASRRVGSAVVNDPDGEGIGIITERDVLASIGAGEDPDTEHVRDHVTTDLIYAAPSWTLEQAADAMMRGSFRHLVVLDNGEVAGILSVRDIVRVWARDRAGDELVG